MDLGLYQTDLCRLFKVTKDCVCYWENGRSHPHITYYPAIIVFLGYYPFDHETTTFGGKIRRYKYEQGLSNRKLAKVLKVDESTVAQWERNTRMPLKRNMEIVFLIITKTAAH